MTTKDKHVMGFWKDKLIELNKEKGGYVSAGEIARYVGQSRNTAKRYMQKLMANKDVVWTFVASRSGSVATVYHVAESDNGS